MLLYTKLILIQVTLMFDNFNECFIKNTTNSAIAEFVVFLVVIYVIILSSIFNDSIFANHCNPYFTRVGEFLLNFLCDITSHFFSF